VHSAGERRGQEGKEAATFTKTCRCSLQDLATHLGHCIVRRYIRCSLHEDHMFMHLSRKAYVLKLRCNMLRVFR